MLPPIIRTALINQMTDLRGKASRFSKPRGVPSGQRHVLAICQHIGFPHRRRLVERGLRLRAKRGQAAGVVALSENGDAVIIDGDDGLVHLRPITDLLKAYEEKVRLIRATASLAVALAGVFLFLPALGRVRRIAGSERQESFVGSDFTYEDIGGREFER